MKMQNFRKFVTSNGSEIIGGKNAEQNENLMKKFIGKNKIAMHTAKPGSPFCVALKKLSRKEEREMAIFCAKYSRDWKKNKKNVEVHIFSGKNVYKNKDMKTGTFGVKKIKKIIVKKKEIERIK